MLYGSNNQQRTNIYDTIKTATNKPAEFCCSAVPCREGRAQMANTARHYSPKPQAPSLVDQMSLSANEHTALPAADEHRELLWHDSPSNNIFIMKVNIIVSITTKWEDA